MFAEERRQKIIEYVHKKGRVTVEEICKLYEVSPATVRKDLNDLNDEGKLRRTHGGAMALSQVDYEANFAEKELQCKNEKQRIAREAVKLIHEGDCIAIDTGTTMLELAKLLGNFKKLKVITNDLTIAGYLDANTDVSLFVIGGEVRKGHHYMMWHLMIDYFKNLNVDTYFISPNGIDAKRGLTSPQMETSMFKQAMMENSREKIVLADSTKFGKVFFSNFADISQVDAIITDDKVDSEEAQSIRELGVELNLVESNREQ